MCSLCDITSYVRFEARIGYKSLILDLTNNYFTDMYINICIFLDIHGKIAL